MSRLEIIQQVSALARRTTRHIGRHQVGRQIGWRQHPKAQLGHLAQGADGRDAGFAHDARGHHGQGVGQQHRQHGHPDGDIEQGHLGDHRQQQRRGERQPERLPGDGLIDR